MEIKFEKYPLAAEQSLNKDLHKLVNVNFVYDLDAYQEILLIISNLKIAYLGQLVL